MGAKKHPQLRRIVREFVVANNCEFTHVCPQCGESWG